ncbi:hypothetical protein VT930_19700 [Mycobacterium sherrisii]|uniref:hypothetical protein n=1 Tax=Mycobacterium sherrisii TaxID=243061 RepID=UPI002DDD04B8|nr:hypothetical protein [Mycobacterium sherrisii]MEC4765305.1 hypothetical protein [Mycobacterium sherrisii]
MAADNESNSPGADEITSTETDPPVPRSGLSAGEVRCQFPENLADIDIVLLDDDDEDDDDFSDVDDESECAFCLGREAGRRGEGEDQNPYAKTDYPPGSIEWIESDYELWLMGHTLGSPPTGPVN